MQCADEAQWTKKKKREKISEFINEVGTNIDIILYKNNNFNKICHNFHLNCHKK